MSLDIIETHLIEIISRSNDVVTKQTASKALGELGRIRVYLSSVQEREQNDAVANREVINPAPLRGPPQPRYTTVGSTNSDTKEKSAYRLFYEKLVRDNINELKGRELSKFIHQEWIKLSPEEKKEYEV
jgi:hypothetical protein